jgi:hypothetical protein
MGGMTRPSSTPRRLLPPGRQAPDDVVVVAWPLRDEGLHAWLLVIGMAATVALGWALWRNFGFTLLTAAAMTLALWRLWLPVKWEIGLTGVTQNVLGIKRRIPWLAIARYEFRSHGVWLYADREESPLRAVFIAYGEQRERIAATIDYYLGAWTERSS